VPPTNEKQRKNHTGRNQAAKAHANGIKKARDYVAKSLKGVRASTFWPYCGRFLLLNPYFFVLPQMDPKFLRNLRFSKKHNKKSKKE